jgi:hypothetical protein
MADPLRAVGYHGTSTAVAQTVLRDGFKISRNVYDWLGAGVHRPGHSCRDRRPVLIVWTEQW